MENTGVGSSAGRADTYSFPHVPVGTPPPPTLKKLMHVDPHATFTEAHTERYTTAYVEGTPPHPHPHH